MKTYLLIILSSLAALHLFLSQADRQGIPSMKFIMNKCEIVKGTVMVTENGGDHVEQLIHRSREAGQYTPPGGKSRKLLSSPMQAASSASTPKTISSKSLKKGNMEGFSDKAQDAVNIWSPVSGHTRKFEGGKYEEYLMDINVMDYSPAKRKTPIHN